MYKSKWFRGNFKKLKERYINQVSELIKNGDIGIIKTFKDFLQEEYIKELENKKPE